MSILLKENHPQTPQKFGFSIHSERARGVIFHASGRLERSPAFRHELKCSLANVADFTTIDDWLNQQAVGAILREEQQEDVRGVSNFLFNGHPDFAIDFVCYPNVGDRRILLRRGIRIHQAQYHSTALALALCHQITHLAELISHPYTQWLITESVQTTRFWHNAIALSYLRITKRS